MDQHELTGKVRELKELKTLAAELQDEITALEDELKAELAASGTDEMNVDIFTVRYQAVRSNRFDSAAFKQTHADLYRQYTRQTEYKRFSVA